MAKKSKRRATGKRTTGLKFECTGCGKCCTRRGKYAYVYVTDEEIAPLARAAGCTERTFRRSYTFIDDRGWRQIRFRDACCPFLDRATNLCTVYEARPVQCRTFPFWKDMVDEHGWTRAARDLCEGVARGPVQPREKVEAAMCEMEAAD